MESLNILVNEYKKQLEKGRIQSAYRGLMEYISSLKADFKRRYPEYSGSGAIYSGYMDMTYFPLFPEGLKDLKLKIAIVFIHESCSFEAWLTGVNRQVQLEYWNLIKKSNWNKYDLVEIKKGVDAIIRHVLAADPKFDDLETLTKQIEDDTARFIKDIEGFLAQTKPTLR